MKLRRFPIRSSMFVGFSASALLALSSPAVARTFVVDDGADCPHPDFPSIQAAVAVAEPGDKVLVCPGVYAESVVINKNDLSIEAQAAPGTVVLQGTAAQEFGFLLLNVTGVLLQGFTVQEFGRGNIRIQGGTGNTVRKNVATLGFIDGIQVISSSANLVEHNIASFNNKAPNSDGIFVSGSTNNIFHQNQSFGNGQVGINLVDSDGNVTRENETFLNRASGINMLRSRGNVAFHNNSHDNGVRGIQNVAQSHRNVIENNRVFANAQGGILIGNSTEVIARNNRSEKNITFGIRLQNGAANNLVEKNEVLRNTQDGIQLENGVVKNVVQLNLVIANGDDGIHVVDQASGENTIERNVIRESAMFDARDDSVGPPPTFTANFWINNKCDTQNKPELCKNPNPF